MRVLGLAKTSTREGEGEVEVAATAEDKQAGMSQSKRLLARFGRMFPINIPFPQATERAFFPFCSSLPVAAARLTCERARHGTIYHVHKYIWVCIDKA